MLKSFNTYLSQTPTGWNSPHVSFPLDDPEIGQRLKMSPMECRISSHSALGYGTGYRGYLPSGLVTAHRGTLLSWDPNVCARCICAGQTIHPNANPREQLQKTTGTTAHTNQGPESTQTPLKCDKSVLWHGHSLSLSLTIMVGKDYLYGLLCIPYLIPLTWWTTLRQDHVFLGKGINNCILIQPRPNNCEPLNFDTGKNLPCLQPYLSRTRPRLEGRWYSWVKQLALRLVGVLFATLGKFLIHSHTRSPIAHHPLQLPQDLAEGGLSNGQI